MGPGLATRNLGLSLTHHRPLSPCYSQGLSLTSGTQRQKRVFPGFRLRPDLFLMQVMSGWSPPFPESHFPGQWSEKEVALGAPEPFPGIISPLRG